MGKKTIERNTPKTSTIIDMKTMKPAELSSIPLICERIRHFRKMCGMEQKELAEKLGVARNSISNWECGLARPDIDMIPTICQALNVSLYDLYAMADPNDKYTAIEKLVLDGYQKLNPSNRLAISRIIETLCEVQEAEKIPDIKELLFFEKSLAAGTSVPTEFDGKGRAMYLYNSKEFDNADYVFSVNGDSMEPRFHNNDLVLVQKITDGSELKPGEIGAFITGNETYIKEYQKDGLHSLNPRYDVIRFESTDNQSVYLIGRVLGILNKSQIANETDVDRYKMMKGV